MASNERDVLGISGTVIAEKYKVGEPVGEGGFSVVYRAEHLIWQQPVALKCFSALSQAPQAHRQSLLDSFIQEGKLLAELSSRSTAIVQARDVGTFNTADGAWVPYMVLEWLDGSPLDSALRDERRARLPARSLGETIRLLNPIAEALDLVHRRNIAHRDIKPANLFILGNARAEGALVKLLDFGIAKVMQEHAHLATALAQTGHTITAFTPNYGAPEQFSRSHGATGPWTDVYAMALILIEVLRGGYPALEGDDYMQLAIASRDTQRRPTPRTLGVEVTDAVEAIFARALAVSPKDRFPAMAEFWAALHAAAFPGANTWRGIHDTSQSGPRLSIELPNSPTVATSANLSSGAVQFTPVTPPGVAQTGAPRGAASRWMALGAGVALAAGAGWFALQSRSGALAPPPPGSAVVRSAVAPPPPRAPSCPGGMALVPGGRFFMGSDEDSPGLKLAHPSHKVRLDPYCIDVHEVTAADYKACSDRGDCKRPKGVPDYPKPETTPAEEHEKNLKAYAEHCNWGKPDRERHPMNCISWELADIFCKAHEKRLPTEAEWEFAARGSDGRKYPWGDDVGDHTFMNACGSECNDWEKSARMRPSPRMYDVDDGFAGTAPVGSFPKGKTQFGLLDMVGNVWEWTADWYADYPAEEQENPRGPGEGTRKVIRGGAFNGGFAAWVNPAFRYHQDVTASVHAIGFRCARSLEPPK